MKKTILLLAGLIILSLNAISQNTYNVVIFSEDGEPFFAFVNGIRQNDKPETNIKITDLNSEALNVRIEFENKALPKLKQNMMPEYGFEHTLNLKKNKKLEMKMRYFGKVALAEAPKSSATAIHYHTAETPGATEATTTQYNTSTGGGNNNTTVTTTSTSTQVNSNPGNVSVNVNMGGVGMNVNINDPTFTNGTMTSTSSTTVTSSSSSSSSSYNTGSSSGNTQNTQNAPSTSQTGSNYGCTKAMSADSYNKLKASVESKPFSDTQMSTAKVATKSSCLSVSQIKGICSLFSMDEDKLTYAKFAYDYCVDKANYYQVSEVFSFSSTTDDLNKFLENR